MHCSALQCTVREGGVVGGGAVVGGGGGEGGAVGGVVQQRGVGAVVGGVQQRMIDSLLSVPSVQPRPVQCAILIITIITNIIVFINMLLIMMIT